MNTDDIFNKFLDKLRAEKSEDEVAEFLADMAKVGSAEMYIALTSVLTDEDLDAIEKIPDDAVAEQEIEDRFYMRTGLTPQDFMEKIRTGVATKYLGSSPAPVQTS